LLCTQMLTKSIIS